MMRPLALESLRGTLAAPARKNVGYLFFCASGCGARLLQSPERFQEVSS